MAMREFESKQEYVAAVAAMGLEVITVHDEEDFAHGTYQGSEGNFGCGGPTSDDGCEPGYYAVLYDTAAEFEEYAYSEDGFAMPPRGCPTGEYVPDAEDEENLREENISKVQRRTLARFNAHSAVKLYPLTQEDLHMAEENGGVTEHVQWHDITCTSVWVDGLGVPHALYEFWYMGDGDTMVDGCKPEWAKFWLTVRDGKLYGEY